MESYIMKKTKPGSFPRGENDSQEELDKTYDKISKDRGAYFAEKKRGMKLLRSKINAQFIKVK